jgi:hypothetical protein
VGERVRTASPRSRMQKSNLSPYRTAYPRSFFPEIKIRERGKVLLGFN